ncbi:MAG: bifunctional diaminohydroxyphosphoribosylaminopyrimidine deaminase/5-amino-6-(5-phosphoribosylamino)uracil reductase RibD [Candidatus Omnitrophota bacterium]|nr:bifunctional diaminohydroxyphosphoribosylaminopyrimidine deaminase/5-amino-6-(5-phosphoribosylamino)uracil reductase RibD [Candidatus Omnitrophota bacterium]
MTDNDVKYMRNAISLARKATGKTGPNPVVGAVVVKGGRIVGAGYHKKAGLPHAEVNALKAAGKRAMGATLYVTLEPCDHFGKTPPCTEAVIKSGIKKVVIAMKDPNPVNNGRGIRKLKKYGISTYAGILQEEAVSMNKPYIKFITKGLPYVTIKAAGSLDGKIAARTGDSKWISSEASRRYVQGLRARADAVMVGVNTVIKDDPILMSWLKKAKQPIRVIVDSRLRTPLNAKIFSRIGQSPVIIATAKKSKKIKSYVHKGAEVAVTGSSGGGRVDLKRLLKILAKKGVMNVLVEGGGELNAGFIEEGLADRMLFFISPKIIGGRDAVTSVEGRGVTAVKDAMLLRGVKVRRFGDDILIEGEI